MKTRQIKTEQIMMCLMFVMCTVVVVTALAAMLTIPVDHVSLAHAAVQGVKSATHAAG